jgi:alkanesulfonate monooxygenase SsuD/methylene tetrahydromethanopterin reductase-like flavin-dependent oxidoreductase (luciferase family)
MMDDLRFGVFLSPHRDNFALTDNALAAEQAGFDFVSIQDHPYVPDFLDPFTIIAHLIGQTTRLRFMTDVANLPLRPAPMLAKTAASLDLLSQGRFDLGIGGGRAWSQIAGLGGPTWNPGQVVQAMDEAITVLRSLWQSDTRAALAGDIYTLRGTDAGPAPAHRIEIWLGAAGSRMLSLIGHRADGWIAPVSTPFETKPAAQQRIDAAAVQAGRDPRDVRRAIQLVGRITDTSRHVERPESGPGGQPIHANPAEWARIIAEFNRQQRFDTVNFIPDREDEEQLSRFGTAVIPAVRAALASRA